LGFSVLLQTTVNQLLYVLYVFRHNGMS